MNEPYIIAEMACSHDGSVEKAEIILEAAEKSGANAVQFQIWEPTECVAPNHADYELLQKIGLGKSNWKSLIDKVHSTREGLEIISCVYGVESAQFAAENGIDVFKIHSSDLGNPALLAECSKLGKRIDLSIGGAQDDEIKFAIDQIRRESNCEIWLMYGIQLFPTPPESLNFSRMDYLRKTFDCEVGFQDHSDPEGPDGYTIPAAAVARGTSIIEKHLTHDRSAKGIDSQAALNPDEFVEFVKTIKMVAQFVGGADSGELTDGEKKYRSYSQKQILVARDLKVGHVVSTNDLVYARPAEWDEKGLPPSASSQIIGKKLKANLAEFQSIQAAHIE